MSISRELLNQLIAQRDALELEADAITQELTSPGVNGEAPAGIKDPLIDKDGFPRGDIDIYNVRAKRQRLAVINTDHKELMKKLEIAMQNVFTEPIQSPVPGLSSSSNHISSISNSSSISISNGISPDVSTLLPIAKIDEILSGSPADSAGLVNGDKLIAFGNITSKTANALVSIPAVVRDNIGKPIEIVIKRDLEIKTLTLVPQVWGGRGVIGCHLTPILM